MYASDYALVRWLCFVFAYVNVLFRRAYIQGSPASPSGNTSLCLGEGKTERITRGLLGTLYRCQRAVSAVGLD